jgi:hypothetical protein
MEHSGLHSIIHHRPQGDEEVQNAHLVTLGSEIRGPDLAKFLQSLDNSPNKCNAAYPGNPAC